MERYRKLLLRLTQKQRTVLDALIDRIKLLDLPGLDIEKLSGFVDLYRVRKGKYRIVFRKHESFGEVINLQVRGQVYKKNYR